MQNAPIDWPDVTREINRVRTRLHDIAEHDVVDAFLWNSAARNNRFGSRHREVGCRAVRQRPAKVAEWRARAGENYYIVISHEASLQRWTSGALCRLLPRTPQMTARCL